MDSASNRARRHPLTQQLRVLALIDSLSWGGAETLLADFAAAGPDAGIDLEVAYLRAGDRDPGAARLRSKGLEPTLVPITGLLHRSARAAVGAHLVAAAPQIVHTHLQYADVLGGLAARRLGIPCVSTIHVTERETGPREWAKAQLAARVRRRCAARVIAVSEEARRAYMAQSGESRQRVVTVRNGIADAPRAGTGPAARERLGLAAEHLLVAMVSVLRPGKGHELAIEAMRALQPRFPELRLVIVGDGPSGEEVRRLAAPLGDSVIMTGHRDDVRDLLDAADILLHPSRFDAFPTVLLEAMAARVPPVATAVGGIPEIVASGETGILVEPSAGPLALAEALTPALADHALRRRLGDSARERFEREFTARAWAERTRAVYATALAAPTASSAPAPAGDARPRSSASPRPPRRHPGGRSRAAPGRRAG